MPFLVFILCLWAGLDLLYAHPVMVTVAIVGPLAFVLLRARRRDRRAAIERRRGLSREHIAHLERMLL